MGERLISGLTPIRIGRRLLGTVGAGTEPLVAVLYQPGSAPFAGEVAAGLRGSGVPVVERALPDGEAAKTLGTIEATASWLADRGLRRDGVLVGVGGGALTDAVGFLASVYMRGVEVRFVPTTLLGAIDAAIGGKTAVNVGGKNLVGTFRLPASVVIDLDLLDSLAPDLIRSGMAEALKAGLVGDPELFRTLEVGGVDSSLETVVERAIAVKLAIVEADFLETGVRAHLNFGHTIGHAVEMASGMNHGESVAVGMMAAIEISTRLSGFVEADRVQAAIERLGLPLECPGLGARDIRRLVEVDKKSDSDGVKMVLLEAIGRPVVSPIDNATLDAGLAAIGIGGT